MGTEIKRDQCPEKYYAKGSIIKDSIPIIISILIVAFFSGSLFSESGMDTVITIIIEIVFSLILYSVFFFMFKGTKKRLAETYISVCENGITGICPLNGYKNKSFEVHYNEITKLTVKGERLFLNTTKGKITLTLKDAAGTAAAIRSRNTSL